MDSLKCHFCDTVTSGRDCTQLTGTLKDAKCPDNSVCFVKLNMADRSISTKYIKKSSTLLILKIINSF